MPLALALLLLPGVIWAASPDGASIYGQHCSSCHDQPGSRVPSRADMSRLSTRRIVNSLESGIMFMPGRRMTPPERRAVAEFLTGKAYAVELRAEPPANSCRQTLTAPLKTAVWSGWSPLGDNTRFQPAGGLSGSDLSRLELKWAFGFADEVMSFGQPALADGTLFVGSASGTVYALDAASGCEYWRYEAEAAVRTAIVVQDGVLWFGDLHANVYAVRARTGKLLWKRKLDEHPSARITAAPALHEGRLYVPVSSFEEGMASMAGYACCTFRGSVVAMSARTGDVLWRKYTVDRTAVVQGKNRAGVPQLGPSGAAVWSTPTVDARRGLLYFTTGDNYGDPGTPLSDAVVAVDLRTGAVAWVQQLTFNDRWNAACLGDKVNCPEPSGPDHDFGASPVLARSREGIELVVAAQKSGMVYALDPDGRGKVVWKAAVGKGGPLGGIQWGHAADQERVYVPLSDVRLDDMAGTGGGLVALRLSDGGVIWKAPPASCEDRTPCSPAQMAAITAIPGAVISGARDGIYRGYSSEDGRVLWSFDTFREFAAVNRVPARGGSIDGPGPVVAGGMMFVNSGYSLWNGRGGNVLLAFGVKDNAQAPKQ